MPIGELSLFSGQSVAVEAPAAPSSMLRGLHYVRHPHFKLDVFGRYRNSAAGRAFLVREVCCRPRMGSIMVALGLVRH
jgi:hypothetical protein